MLGLTSAITLGVVASYVSQSAHRHGARVWRTVVVRLAHHPIDSTSNADVDMVLLSVVGKAPVDSRRFGSVLGRSLRLPSGSSLEGLVRRRMARALEAKKSCYDFDSIVSIESLASIRERYSILNEYVLYARGLGNVLTILAPRFHYLIISTYGQFCKDREHELDARQSQGRRGCRELSSLQPQPPTLAPPTGSRSPSKVQEILVEEVTRRAPEEEARRAPEVPSKRQVEDSVGQKKKRKVFNRHRPHHDPIVETSTPRPKLRSVRELCGARPEMDDRDYRAIWMCNLSEHAPDAPRDRLDAADAQDAYLAGRRGFGEIYQRHVDPSAGIRRIHLVV
ncbi:hypothetical protein BHM03_00056440 [Ensete ventricosum]|nr:hypothetical protein BHM03_00056440 [Ensete ventricosum]